MPMHYGFLIGPGRARVPDQFVISTLHFGELAAVAALLLIPLTPAPAQNSFAEDIWRNAAGSKPGKKRACKPTDASGKCSGPKGSHPSARPNGLGMRAGSPAG